MFTCSACLRRAVNVFIDSAELPAAQHGLRLLHTRPSTHTLPPTTESSTSQRRHTATFAGLSRSKGHHRRQFREVLRSKATIEPRKTRSKANRSLLRDEAARINNRKVLARNEGTRPYTTQPPTAGAAPNFPPLTEDQEKARIEMHYLKDPVKLAEAVSTKLRKGQAMAALELIRTSHKDRAFNKGMTGENVVSWNHMMDWCWAQKDWDLARKSYNEMKKRGGRPDAHTFTIMMRGYAQMSRTNPIKAVYEAKKVWRSIAAETDKSGVSRNTIHTNAMIAVCARALDVEAMWEVLMELPETGPGAPDAITYSTVLNALQASALKRAAMVGLEQARTKGKEKVEEGEESATKEVEEAEEEEEDEDDEDRSSRSKSQQGGRLTARSAHAQAFEIFEEAVANGKKLWVDVIARWRKGDIILDERLICAMGRLLMVSQKSADWENILALLAQTTGIRNLRPRRWQFVRNPNAVDNEIEDENGEVVDNNPQTLVEDHEREENESAELSTANTSTALTTPDDLFRSSMTDNAGYAMPGNNTMSLLLETCILLRLAGAGKKYWDILTGPDGRYVIKADAQNVMAYLRLLRLSRASKLAVELLEQASRESSLSTGTNSSTAGVPSTPSPATTGLTTTPPLTTTKTMSSTVPALLARHGTYIVVMSTCVRDKLNLNSFDHADRVLDVMDRHLDANEDDSDGGDYGVAKGDGAKEVKTLALYVDLSVATTPGLLRVRERGEERARGETETGTRKEKEMFIPNPTTNNVMKMFARLGGDIAGFRRLLADKVEEREDVEKHRNTWKGQLRRFIDKRGEAAGLASVEGVLELLKQLNRACDLVIGVEERGGVRFRGVDGEKGEENMGEEEWREYVKEVRRMKRGISMTIFKMVGNEGVGVTGRGRRRIQMRHTPATRDMDGGRNGDRGSTFGGRPDRIFPGSGASRSGRDARFAPGSNAPTPLVGADVIRSEGLAAPMEVEDEFDGPSSYGNNLTRRRSMLASSPGTRSNPKQTITRHFQPRPDPDSVEDEHGEDSDSLSTSDVSDLDLHKSIPSKRAAWRALSSGKVDHERQRSHAKMFKNAKRGLNEVKRGNRRLAGDSGGEGGFGFGGDRSEGRGGFGSDGRGVFSRDPREERQERQKEGEWRRLVGRKAAMTRRSVPGIGTGPRRGRPDVGLGGDGEQIGSQPDRGLHADGVVKYGEDGQTAPWRMESRPVVPRPRKNWKQVREEKEMKWERKREMADA